jgi:hypothetical protein
MLSSRKQQAETEVLSTLLKLGGTHDQINEILHVLCFMSELFGCTMHFNSENVKEN